MIQPSARGALLPEDLAVAARKGRPSSVFIIVNESSIFPEQASATFFPPFEFGFSPLASHLHGVTVSLSHLQ